MVRVQYLAALIVALIAYFSVSADDYEAELEEGRLYCEMVTLNMEDPSSGWPDYKGIYDKECEHD